MISKVDAQLYNTDIRDVSGSSIPKCYRCNDNETYVVKFYNQNIGKRVLPNEYISYLLAHNLGLPILETKLVYIDEYILDDSHAWLGSGLQLGIKYDKKAINLKSNLIFQIRNLNDIAKIIVFDQWIHNLDRGVGYDNWLITPNNDQYLLSIIDHSDVFGGKKWNVNWLNENKNKMVSFRANQATYNDLFQNSNSTSEELYEFANHVSNFDSNLISEIVNSVPKEWGLLENEIQAIIEFLDERKQVIINHLQSQNKLNQMVGSEINV